MTERVKYSLKMTIAGLPRMANSSGRSTHRFIVIRERKAWQHAVAVLVPFTQRPPAPLKRARLVLTRCSTVEPDTDGLVSGFKFIIDALVQTKILENDRRTNIGIPDYRWEKAKPGSGHVKIEVHELDEKFDHNAASNVASAPSPFGDDVSEEL